MRLESKRDIALVRRAMREDWPTSPEKKQVALDALMEVFSLKDPELTLKAFLALVEADKANIKRTDSETKAKAVEQHQQQIDDDRKLQLIELAQRLGIGGVNLNASEGVIG